MYNNKKKIVIIVMCIAIFVMITGYSLLSTRLNIRGTSNLTDTWGIKISNISYTATGRAHNIEEPTYNDTNMTFNVGVKEPGDKMVFDVTVTNYGTLDAILKDVDATTSGSSDIIYSINGLYKGSKLVGNGSITFTVTTQFNVNATKLPTDTVKSLNINLHYVQDDGQTITVEPPTIIDNTPTTPTDPTDPDTPSENSKLADVILLNNTAQSDENIDFSVDAEGDNVDDNESGLFYTNVETEDNKRVYYFRGDVNNSVYFANYEWKIVRINEDGSIRIILAGNNVGTNAFNSDQGYFSSVGFMYQPEVRIEAKANTTDSDIKIALDQWYVDNLSNYSSFIVDAGFCGDRSLAASDIVSNDNYGELTSYAASYERIIISGAPQFKCPDSENDLYTTISGTKGNKVLTYPIGLLTLDELIYAGITSANRSNHGYLENVVSDGFWTMTPAGMGSYASVWYVKPDMSFAFNNVYNPYYVLPVINLKADVTISGGDGASGDPYIIVTE